MLGQMGRTKGKRSGGVLALGRGKLERLQAQYAKLDQAGLPGPVVDELIAQGLVVPRTSHEEVTVGPFIFKGQVVNNATTTIDLTDADAMCDAALIEHQMGGAVTDKPEVALVVDGIAVVVSEADTRALDMGDYRDLVRNLQMVHKVGGDTKYRPLHSHLRSMFAHINEEGNTAGTPVYRGILPPYIEPIPLREGFVVDLASDTWTIGPRAALDTNANLDLQVFVSGVAFPSRYLKTRKRSFRGIVSPSQFAKQFRKRVLLRGV